MDFALNEEQQMLHEAAQRFLADTHPNSRARRTLPWQDPSQRSLWKDMANMGWTSLLVSEEHGGCNLGVLEASIIAELSGHYLLNLPWASSAVLLAMLHQAAGTQAPAELHQALQAIVQGERAVHCITQQETSWDYAAQCSDFLHVQGLNDDAGPLQLAFVAAAALKPLPALDTTLSLGAAPSLPAQWHQIDISPTQRQRIRAAYRLMQACELVGVAQAALSMSSAYAKERAQFGKLIGSYQAIKHQLANVWMATDNARLATMYAAAALDSQLPDQPLACAVAEFSAIEAALQASRAAVQVHGAIGFTWEHDAHLYLKRAQHLATRLGGASAALSRVEAIGVPQLA